MSRPKSLALLRLALIFCIFVAAITFLIPTISDDLPKVASARITIHGEGVVQIREPDKEWIKAKDNQEVAVGTEIKTDDKSSAEITYKTGTVTQIDNNTEITLRNLTYSPTKILVSLEKGRVWSRVEKLADGESYQTQTKTTTTTVHGTAYSHEILPSGEDRVIVTQSTVSVSCIGSDDNSEKEVQEGNMLTGDCYKHLFTQKAPQKLIKQSSNFESSMPSAYPAVQYGAQVQGIQTSSDANNNQTPAATPQPSVASQTPAPTRTPAPARPSSSLTPSPSPVNHPPASPTANPTPTPALTNTPTPTQSIPDYCHPPYKGGKPEECK